MAKEWILNQANMRWGLTRKNKVGPVSELIRKCEPSTLQEWEEYYLSCAYSKEYLEQLGKTLFIKVTDVCKAEIEDITEEDYGQEVASEIEQEYWGIYAQSILNAKLKID